MMSGHFDGKVCVVTGAASGIGLAVSQALLHGGAVVVLADRDADRLASAVDGLDAPHARMHSAPVDVTSQSQVHNLVDASTHLETLSEWKAAGRVRYVGITHYVSSAYPEIERIARSRELDFVQLNYSLGEREAERRILDVLADLGIGVIVNRPFGGGALFRRVRGHEVPDWAQETGIARWGQFFLKYILGHPAVTCVIPGTSKVEHLNDNLDAGRGPLPDAEHRRRMAEYFDQL